MSTMGWRDEARAAWALLWPKWGRVLFAIGGIAAALLAVGPILSAFDEYDVALALSLPRGPAGILGPLIPIAALMLVRELPVPTSRAQVLGAFVAIALLITGPLVLLVEGTVGPLTLALVPWATSLGASLLLFLAAVLLATCWSAIAVLVRAAVPPERFLVAAAAAFAGVTVLMPTFVTAFMQGMARSTSGGLSLGVAYAAGLLASPANAVNGLVWALSGVELWEFEQGSPTDLFFGSPYTHLGALAIWSALPLLLALARRPKATPPSETQEVSS